MKSTREGQKPVYCNPLTWIAVAALLAASGCDLREPTATPPADPAPSAPGPAATPTQGVAAEPTDLPLKAGLEWAVAHVLAKHQAYQPVEPLPDDRFLLHPGEKERARLVLDVSRVEELTLSPRIESFEGNATCTADPQAGVATLYWSLDGGNATGVAIDRHFHDTVQISTKGAKQLTLEGDNGNGVIWCDWLAVGFPVIRPR